MKWLLILTIYSNAGPPVTTTTPIENERLCAQAYHRIFKDWQAHLNKSADCVQVAE